MVINHYSVRDTKREEIDSVDAFRVYIIIDKCVCNSLMVLSETTESCHKPAITNIALRDVIWVDGLSIEGSIGESVACPYPFDLVVSYVV